MKSRGVKGVIFAALLTAISAGSVSAQDKHDGCFFGIVAKEKFNSKAASLNDYKHSQFVNSSDEGGMVISVPTKNVLVNENYKQQVGAPTETPQRLPLAKESVVDERVVKAAYYKHQASM